MAGQVPGPLGGLVDGPQRVVVRVVAPNVFQHHFAEAQDDRQKIVEIVGHAARQTAYGFELLGLVKLLFKLALLEPGLHYFGGVACKNQGAVAAGKLDGNRRHFDMHRVAVKPQKDLLLPGGRGLLAAQTVHAFGSRRAEIGVQAIQNRAADEFFGVCGAQKSGCGPIQIAEVSPGLDKDAIRSAFHQHSKALLTGPQRPLRALAFGDVLHRPHDADHLAVVIPNGRGGQAALHRTAVLFTPHQLQVGKIAAGHQKTAQARKFSLFVVGHDGQGPAQDFIRLPAEDPLGRSVPGQHITPGIDTVERHGRAGDHGPLKRLAPGQGLFDPLALGNVIDDGVEQLPAAQLDRAAEDLDNPNRAVGAPVAKGEVSAPLTDGRRHCTANLLLAQGVDIGNPLSGQPLARPAVKGAGGRIGVHDRAVLRVDDQHRGMIVVEETAVVALPLLQFRTIDQTPEAPPAFLQLPPQRFPLAQLGLQRSHPRFQPLVFPLQRKVVGFTLHGCPFRPDLALMTAGAGAACGP